MKIEHTNVHAPRPDEAKERRVEETARPDQGGAPAGGSVISGSRETDQISLSSLSQQLRALGSTDGARTAKVDELQALVDSGNYRVDSGVLASHLIDDALTREADF